MFNDNGGQDVTEMLKKNIHAANKLKMPNERFNKCVVTLSNPILEFGYEAPFEIVFFQIKTS